MNPSGDSVNVNLSGHTPKLLALGGLIKSAVIFFGVSAAAGLLCGPAFLACSPTAFAIGFGVSLASAVITHIQLTAIVTDPPDPDFATIFLPQDYAPLTVGPGSGLPPEVLDLTNLTFGKLTDLYELTEAWRVTQERYRAAVAAGDLDATEAQLAALENYILSSSEDAASAGVSLTQLANNLETLIGPVQISQSDIETGQAVLAQNGFAPEVLEFFNNLGLPQEAINDILTTILEVDATEAPTELFAGFGQLAESYGELAELTSCIGNSC